MTGIWGLISLFVFWRCLKGIHSGASCKKWRFHCNCLNISLVYTKTISRRFFGGHTESRTILVGAPIFGRYKCFLELCVLVTFFKSNQRCNRPYKICSKNNSFYLGWRLVMRSPRALASIAFILADTDSFALDLFLILIQSYWNGIFSWPCRDNYSQTCTYGTKVIIEDVWIWHHDKSLPCQLSKVAL